MRLFVSVLSMLLLSIGLGAQLQAEDMFGGGGDGADGTDGDGLGNVVDAQKEGGLGDQAAEPDPEEAKKADEAAAKAKLLNNVSFLNAVKSYASSKKLGMQTYGKHAFRIMKLGNAKVDNPTELVKLGEQSLQGLDAWTGKQGIFYPKTVEERFVNYLIVIPDNAFNGFVDFIRSKGAKKPEGDDLVKKLRVQPGSRCYVIISSKFNKVPIMPAHWAVNLSAGMSISAFFKDRGSEKPAPWISEGLKAELERILTKDKTPRITAIAYEDKRPEAQGTGDWPKDIAKLIRDKSSLLLPANSVMDLDLIAMNAVNYKQMWSFCQYVKGVSSRGRGEKNKFYMIMDSVARGNHGASAIIDVLKKKDPALSRSWLAWAAQQR